MLEEGKEGMKERKLSWEWEIKKIGKFFRW
jgi:hypothetical protein